MAGERAVVESNLSAAGLTELAREYAMLTDRAEILEEHGYYDLALDLREEARRVLARLVQPRDVPQLKAS